MESDNLNKPSLVFIAKFVFLVFLQNNLRIPITWSTKLTYSFTHNVCILPKFLAMSS
jgi:hypothetical protein